MPFCRDGVIGEKFMNKNIKIVFLILLCFNIFSLHVTDLSLEQKIGQLLMVAVPTDCNEQNFKAAKKTLVQYNIGSIIFLGSGTVEKQVELTKQFQSLSKIPFLIAKDFEPGFFRLTDVTEFPKNRTLGSTNEELVFNLGKQIGKFCNLIGVHINFAPVVDVSCNPKNPVIRMRSFGQDKIDVAKKGISFANGIQSENVIACAKHFPGHGDTATDSHEDLPIIKHKRDRLEKIEFVPFKELINNGVSAVMMAHIKVPVIDQKYPASLSKKTINILKKDFGFNGLIISDALNMKGILQFSGHPEQGRRSQAEAAVLALKAGNDIVILGRPKAGFTDFADQEDYLQLYQNIVPAAFQKIKEAVLSGDLLEEEIDKKVEKILAIKSKFFPIKITKDNKELHEKLHQWDSESQKLKQEIFRNSLVKNGNLSLGKKILDAQLFGAKEALIKNVDIINLSDFELKDLKNYDQVVLEIFNVDVFAKNYGISDSDLAKIKTLELRNKIILVIYGLPYISELFYKKTPSIIAHENCLDARDAVKSVLV